jgi:5-formyltetrahydrofolate cyclo-ligase
MPDSDKEVTRRNMLEKRNSQTVGDNARRSELVQGHIVKSIEFQAAKIVGTYFATGSEVNTHLLIGEAKRLGKAVALPRIEGDMITFYEVSSTDKLIPGGFGIMEPPSTRPVHRMDVLAVPGIAFDKKGYRLGYGKGYYDRYLSEKKPQLTIGLAYNFQLLESLPHDMHDARMDAVATEDGILYV